MRKINGKLEYENWAQNWIFSLIFFFFITLITNVTEVGYVVNVYLLNETPGKMSMLALRAMRFNDVIPLIDKHVSVSSLVRQFAINWRNDAESSATFETPGAATANANTADNTTNTFIFIDWFFLFRIFVSQSKKIIALEVVEIGCVDWKMNNFVVSL